MKAKPGDKLIVYSSRSDSASFLAEMVDYDRNYDTYLVIQEAKLSEIKKREVPKIDFEPKKDENEFASYGEDSPSRVNESILASQVLQQNEVLMNSVWVKSEDIRKIQMEPLSGIQKLIAKLFDL